VSGTSELRGIVLSALVQQPMTSLDHGAVAAVHRTIDYVDRLETILGLLENIVPNDVDAARAAVDKEGIR
jgi:hypothetical protein